MHGRRRRRAQQFADDEGAAGGEEGAQVRKGRRQVVRQVQRVHPEHHVEAGAVEALRPRFEVDVEAQRPQLAPLRERPLDRPGASAQERGLELRENVFRGRLAGPDQRGKRRLGRASASATDLEDAGAGARRARHRGAGDDVVQSVVRVRVGEVVEPEAKRRGPEEGVLAPQLAPQHRRKGGRAKREHLVRGSGRRDQALGLGAKLGGGRCCGAGDEAPSAGGALRQPVQLEGLDQPADAQLPAGAPAALGDQTVGFGLLARSQLERRGHLQDQGADVPVQALARRAERPIEHAGRKVGCERLERLGDCHRKAGHLRRLPGRRSSPRPPRARPRRRPTRRGGGAACGRRAGRACTSR